MYSASECIARLLWFSCKDYGNITRIVSMSLIDFLISLSLISVVAGLLGSVIGLGGGVIIVPVLTLVYHVDIRLAIGASILSVIATSSGAAVTYVKEKLTNLRVGMFLEIATTIGALTGAYITTLIDPKLLFILFAVVLIYSALTLLRKRKGKEALTKSHDKIANYLNLHGEYYDQKSKKLIRYKVTNTRLGLGIMYVAGLASALLGVGSGALKVPAMDVAMHMPMKASAATSDFMIGVTAAASAGAYFVRGEINPLIAGPVVLGVLVGAIIGSRLLNRASFNAIKYLFIAVLAVISIEMLQRGFS
jgi:uncharacterized membrane protein YfcA